MLALSRTQKSDGCDWKAANISNQKPLITTLLHGTYIRVLCSLSQEYILLLCPDPNLYSDLLSISLSLAVSLHKQWAWYHNAHDKLVYYKYILTKCDPVFFCTGTKCWNCNNKFEANNSKQIQSFLSKDKRFVHSSLYKKSQVPWVLDIYSLERLRDDSSWLTWWQIKFCLFSLHSAWFNVMWLFLHHQKEKKKKNRLDFKATVSKDRLTQ